jgi:hypothetical protein
VADDMSVVVSAAIPPGNRLAQRMPLTLAIARMPSETLERRKPARSIHFCGDWSDADLKSGDGPCLVRLVPIRPEETATLGLAQPPAPAALTTPAESAAKRPWWVTTDPYAPADAAPKVASQDPMADTELIACRATSTTGSGWMRIPSAGVDVPWSRMAKATAVLPLAHVRPNGAFTVEVAYGDAAAPKPIGTAAMERREGAIVRKNGPAPRELKDLTCTPYDRAAVEAEVSARWSATVDAIDVAMDHADAFRLDPQSTDLRPASKRLAAARSSVTALATFVGWADPRVAHLVARLDEADAIEGRRLRAGLAAVLGDKRDATLRSGLPDRPDYAVRVLGLRCDGAASCGLEVELKGAVGPVSGLAFQIVTEDGHLVRASMVADPSVQGGATSRLLVSVAPGERLPPGAKPWALVQQQFFTTRLHLVP